MTSRSDQQEAATAVEYALMAGLVAVAIATAVGAVGEAVIPLFQGFLDAMGW